MKKSEKMYFVTTVRTKDKSKFGNSRCIAYYNSLKSARQLIKIQAETLSEAGYYQYAVIERFFSDTWYPYGHFDEWYKLLKTKAKLIPKPKRFKQVCNFGIG